MGVCAGRSRLHGAMSMPVSIWQCCFSGQIGSPRRRTTGGVISQQTRNPNGRLGATFTESLRNADQLGCSLNSWELRHG
jgi:hypothetical protein